MQKIIIDVDTGIDDALAIAYAVKSPDAHLLGITTTYGMAPADHTYRNTCKILEYLGCEVPVFKGAENPLVRTKEYGDRFHGDDGLGEVLGPVEKPIYSSLHSVDYLIEQVYKHQKDLTIVTTGPLTNLALAIAKDPDMIMLVGKVVIMGGAVTTPGNATKFAESNVYIDPEAANHVFRSKLPITLVGLDITRRTLLTKEDVERWRKKGTEVSNFFANFTDFYLNAYKEMHPYLKGCALHDPLAVGVAVHPEIVQTLPMNIEVDLEDDARGRTSEDLQRIDTSKPNTNVCVQVDAQRFMNDFYKYVI